MDQTKHPDAPYLIFTHDGQRYKTRHDVLHDSHLKDIQASFAQDEVGSTLHEVTGFYIQYPEYFGDGRSNMVAGSRDEYGKVPVFYGYKGHQNVSATEDDDRRSKTSGTFSRGRNVIELGLDKIPTPQKVAA